MTKITSFFIAVSACAMLVSCNNNAYKKTPSGVMYKIISSGSGPLVKNGEILKFHYSQKLNDSSLFNSFSSIPTYAKVDSSSPANYSPLEVFPFLHKGDSLVIVQLADTIMKRIPPGQPNPLKKGDKITLTMKILDILKSDDVAQADQTREIQGESDREVSAIQKYLASKNVNTQKTPKGVFVSIQTPGDGPAVDSGKYVSVIYTGKLFASDTARTEKVFETNANKEPIQFTINSGQVIPGWDEGLKMLKKGGKATLYIPATLAYGQQPGPGGKPFENLIFDVHVVDVANAAPKQPQMPQMPTDMNGGGAGQQGQGQGGPDQR